MSRRAIRNDDRDTDVRRELLERARGRRVSARRMPVRPRLPERIRRAYMLELRKFSRELSEEIAKNIFPVLVSLVREAAPRKDSRMDAWPQRVEQLLALTRSAFADRSAALSPMIRRFAVFTAQHNEEEQAGVIRSVMAVSPTFRAEPVAAMIDSFIAENVSLIKSINQRLHDEVEGILQRGLREGKRANMLREEIRERFGVSESRANLIARDQIGKLDAQLTKERQGELGITKFIWRTAQDNRVRPDHEDREGQTYSWDDPPDGELPGTAIQCRCVAIPVMEELLEEVAA